MSRLGAAQRDCFDWCGGRASSSAPDMNIVIHNEGQAAQVSRSEERTGSNGMRELHVWLKSEFQSGRMDRTMTDNFGVSRRGR